MDQTLIIKTAITILKPAAAVFEAIADPQQMRNYFIETSTGRMETGKTVTWKFPEFDMLIPVKIDRAESPVSISYFWSDEYNFETLVKMNLESKGLAKTTVRVTEQGHCNDDKGLLWYGRNTEGWANFLACLKAWMEYGINLRTGAFDASQMPEN